MDQSNFSYLDLAKGDLCDIGGGEEENMEKEASKKGDVGAEKLMEGGRKGKVCVTGGAGYFASWLVMRLLQHGYSVRATVRFDPKFNEDTAHLKALPNASEHLEIVDADLNHPESFEAAIDGCMGVFHTAHPLIFDAEDPDKMVITPALDGLHGILKACKNSKTVKRIVYTSSASAAVFNGQDLKEIDESVWTDVDYCRTLDLPITPYFVSKTLTEKAALEFAEKNGLELVTVVASSIVGPFLMPHMPGSFSTSMALILGDREQCKVLKQHYFVHIDDLASAHIFLFECEEAKGRYICSSNNTDIHTLAEIISNRFPEYPLPMDLLSEMEKQEAVPLSSKKLLELGFEFKNGLQEMFDEAIRCCEKKGLLNPPSGVVS